MTVLCCDCEDESLLRLCCNRRLQLTQPRVQLVGPRIGWDQKKRAFEPGEDSAMQME